MNGMPDGLDALRRAFTAPVTDAERALVAAANAEIEGRRTADEGSTEVSEVDRTVELDESERRVIRTSSIASLDDYVKEGRAAGAGPRKRARADEALNVLHGWAVDEDIREHGGAMFPERAGR